MSSARWRGRTASQALGSLVDFYTAQHLQLRERVQTVEMDLYWKAANKEMAELRKRVMM